MKRPDVGEARERAMACRAELAKARAAHELALANLIVAEIASDAATRALGDAISAEDLYMSTRQ